MYLQCMYNKKRVPPTTNTPQNHASRVPGVSSFTLRAQRESVVFSSSSGVIFSWRKAERSLSCSLNVCVSLYASRPPVLGTTASSTPSTSSDANVASPAFAAATSSSASASRAPLPGGGAKRVVTSPGDCVSSPCPAAPIPVAPAPVTSRSPPLGRASSPPPRAPPLRAPLPQAPPPRAPPPPLRAPLMTIERV